MTRPACPPDALALLTVVVPTYNRAAHLQLLLQSLAGQPAAVRARVAVIVGDNASTDATPEVAAAFAADYPHARVMRHAVNVGPEENFCLCLEQVDTPWFWIFGDDDLPKPGVLAAVLDLLQSAAPDLVYLRSEWLASLQGPGDGTPVRQFTPVPLTHTAMARDAHVWLTFISGLVVRRERLQTLSPPLELRRFTGTSLVQLGWILPLLRPDSRLWMVPQPCILATAGNSGGYRVVEVFGTRLPQIIRAALPEDSPVARILLRALAWGYMPGLLWLSRGAEGRRFEGEDVRASLAPLRASLAYPLLLWPIAHLPRPLAQPFLLAARVIGRVRALAFGWRYRRALRAGAPGGRA